ncbi:hypothetical protein A0H81_04631 [Grifola frondosa]|uniref:Hook C-terminal domain-containing protein n=1 Tax=Grifola frondosa TaxID=5627 RepID=A0A1C7MKY8_GRIFR|nr:hypothetical protein A0H81_04631 [Grifola frondosa]
MESYKTQIAELETKASARNKEMDTVKFELEQTKAKLKAAVDERARDSETLELYQERVPASESNGNMDKFTEAELLGHHEEDHVDDEDAVAGLGDELDSAIAGTTMTDLKLQEWKIDGRWRRGCDCPASALNETVDELDKLRKEHTELEVKFETQKKELTIARSDLNLVNKDQLEILATLRESVNEDKAGLEKEVERLLTQVKENSDKNKMQLEQINGLLLEKRERAIGDLRASISGKDVPEDIKSRLLNLHEENVNLKEQYKTAQEKLLKAKAFIKQQDKLFKEEHAKKDGTVSSGAFEEAEESYRSQIKYWRRILHDRSVSWSTRPIVTVENRHYAQYQSTRANKLAWTTTKKPWSNSSSMNSADTFHIAFVI